MDFIQTKAYRGMQTLKFFLLVLPKLEQNDVFAGL